MGSIIPKQIITLLVIYAFLFVHVHAAIINGTAASEDRAFKSNEIETGRTFGTIKRFQAALLPIMYKLGVMSAVIMMTLFLAFKGVFIGTLILVLNITFFALKFGSYLKHDQGHYFAHPHGGWTQPVHHGHGWGPQKDVHLHIHNAHGKPDFSIPYSTLSGSGGWDTQGHSGHSSSVDPSWSTGGSYVHSGRGFSGDDLTPYAGAMLGNRRSTDKSSAPKVMEKRSDQQPTIVMAQTKHAVTPFNYLNKQNRRK
ncbi:uncharacterized protein LOC129575422 [Sitodiplosis mosellana]|uniref:uncharacterized protein LOC129575422 n=1 Tax=Sitodiplosis mosellana TaxID=263140 RepID=UPI00244404FB|nr:uncharacterized protein LOC129575422 [Sitodiplosis mosellana]XP_055314999.1 uncharacterized protein LOC129575422 [Sitodiplosis mosellana]XP_055315000.1 uncharacterized protein LOC129575422 [Sitodiplosis mosellana]XP_055315001.1 uncharacterized protein LOC129575422 [Sitodiplosis mosellana]